MSGLRQLFPFASQLKGYGGAELRGDLVAGLTVGVMLIPQGMAYALIAGLPPIYGLYAALVPLVVYAFFGTSRHLAVGPVAMISLLVAAGVAPLAEGDAERYITLALTLSLMVGAIQLVLGLARFGFLTNFLSHPVLSGFTSAAAIIIGLSQLKDLIGVPLPRTVHVHELLVNLAQNLGDIHLTTLLIGVLAVAALLGLKRWRTTFPGALAIVAIATVAVWQFSLDSLGVQIVGSVPDGLPAPFLPNFHLGDLRSLLPIALTIALVGFMESIAVAKVYASKFRYEVDANRELVGLGLANIVGAFFRAYPTTGGFSRSAVNATAGARTGVAGLISAVIIAVTLLFLTPLFYFLPRAVLAAIVIVAVISLIDIREIRVLYRTNRNDLALLVVTFLVTLFVGIEAGILVGVVASLILVIQQSSYPQIAVLGRIPGTDEYRDVSRNPDADREPGVAVVRMNASLYFANANRLREFLLATANTSEMLHTIVLDGYPINRLDSTGAHALKATLEDLSDQGVTVRFAAFKGNVRDTMLSSGVVAAVDSFYPTVHEAVTTDRSHHRARPEPDFVVEA